MSPSSSLSNEFAEKRDKQPGNEEAGERSRKETKGLQKEHGRKLLLDLCSGKYVTLVNWSTIFMLCFKLLVWKLC